MKKGLFFLLIIVLVATSIAPVYASPKKSQPNLLQTTKPTKIKKTIARKAQIRKVTILPCNSLSCNGWLTTLRVDGINFTPEARVAAVDDSRVYSEETQDARYVGGDGKRVIITDFYHLPTCKTYDVRVYFPDGSYVAKKRAFSLPCS